MKKLYTIIVILFSTCSPAIAQQDKDYGGYMGGDIGLTFGKDWNIDKNKEVSFAPKSFFFNLYGGYQSKSNWLYEGCLRTSPSPIVGLYFGKQISIFQVLAGADDWVSVEFKPIHVIQGISFSATTRILIGNYFYISTHYSNGYTFLSVGVKSF